MEQQHPTPEGMMSSGPSQDGHPVRGHPQQQQQQQQQQGGGIDIRQALDILAAHRHSHDDIACHKQHVPDEAKQMGQTIDLVKTKTETTTTTIANDDDDDDNNHSDTVAASHDNDDLQQQQHERTRLLDEERTRRDLEIKKQLSSMSVRDLLPAVLEAQRERVMTYRDYDRGLELVLTTGNMSQYPAMCAKATASFSVLSDTIKSIMDVLQHRDRHWHTVLVTLQTHEQRKLNLTAALHLERLRERNCSQQQQEEEEDTRVSGLLREGVATLKQQIGECVEAINEVLEELRYALSAEEEE